jgi:hypothetical protein
MQYGAFLVVTERKKSTFWYSETQTGYAVWCLSRSHYKKITQPVEFYLLLGRFRTTYQPHLLRHLDP